MNRLNVHRTVLLLIFVGMFTAAGQAQHVKEHPLIRPFPGSTLNENMCSYKEFDEYSFRTLDPSTNKEVKSAVRGKSWRLLYTLYTPDGNWDKSHSALEYRENYKAAALEHGGSVLYDKGNLLVFTIPSKSGGKTWVELQITNSAQQNLRIIEEAGFKKSLTFGPAEMKAALDADGRVQLYDILFDVDKSTLQPESNKQLQHVVTLLRDDPELRLEVQGHTDDHGTDDYNLGLSQRRAETVVGYLTLFGIAPDRLIPRGFGESQPLAPNTTDEGRAKNRRVELVRLGTQGATPPPEHPEDISRYIIGNWVIAPNARLSGGSVIFRDDGSYEMSEEHLDGTTVGKKGEYRIHTTSSPTRIEICLEKCGNPGAEFTTSFSIIRKLADGRLEICTSSTENYPTVFSADRSDKYTMVLTRTES